MLYKKSYPKIALLNLLLFSCLVILQSSGVLPLAIKQATPLYILGLFIAYCIFSSVKYSALTGFLVGAVLDSTSSEGYGFNTIVLTVLGVAVCLCANNLFNKNIFAACVMSLLCSLIYFGTNWLIFNAFDISLSSGIEFLFHFSLPSAIYSAAFVIPFFYIYKHFDNIRNK